jgi:protein-disulfide isomerase
VRRSRFLFCCIIAISAAGCRAQNAPAGSAAASAVSNDPQVNRRIEILVRSQMQVPSDYSVTIGARSKSAFTGFDTVPITFALPSKPTAKPTTVDFLLSQDGKTLARLQKFDLTKDPANVAQLANRPVRGTDTAKVTIVNFDDLECPYCARMHRELFPQTIEHYKGLIKVVYKDDPLVDLHPWAMHAAVDANCLADQNGTAYWSYVDYVHSHGEEISGPNRDPGKANLALDRIAREQGSKANVNATTLDACLEKQDNGAVLASMKEAEGLNIDGTPTLFVNGERISGAEPVERVWAVIDRALEAEGQKPPPASQDPAGANAAKSPTGN